MSLGHELERDIDIDLGGMFNTLWQNSRRLLIYGAAAALLALVMLQFISPKYRSDTQILIESRDRSLVPNSTNANVETQRAVLDQQGIASQVQILTSRDLARAVIRDLKLDRVAEFDAAISSSVFTDLMWLIGLVRNPIDIPPEDRALSAYYKKLRVSQAKGSRIINIEFSSKDPRLAAEIANKIAEEYLRIQTDVKRTLNSTEADVLQIQIEKLSVQVERAEQDVALYRSSSDLLMGRDNASLATQQLVDLSTELSRVRVERAAAEAKVSSINSVIGQGASIDAISDVLSSPLIQRLRERQLTLSSRVAELSSTLLSGHPQIKSLKSQLANLGEQIRKETNKVLRSLKTDAKEAGRREKALLATLSSLKAESSRVGEEEVGLRKLERQAAAQRDLLQSIQLRYRETKSKQEQNFLAADARIISRATIPLKHYFPKIMPIVIAIFFGTIMMGSMIILAGVLLRPRAQQFAGSPTERRTPDLISDAPPVLDTGSTPQDDDTIDELVDSPPLVPAYDKSENSNPADSGAAVVAKSISMLGKARIALLSPEGEIGSEGSVLLARYLATAGASVIVVDMTGAGASSLAMIGPHKVPGIKDLLAGQASFGDVIHCDQGSRAHIIPTGAASTEEAALASDQLFTVFDALEDSYDYVIIDCGAADIAGLSRISKPTTINVINAIDVDNPVIAIASEMLVHAGFRKPLIIHPSDHERTMMGTAA